MFMVKDNFFDRKEYLDILAKRIGDLKYGYRQNLAIVGEEFIGKTSILFKFLSKFHDNHIITLYLETRPESLNSFAKRFIGVLLYNFLLNSGLTLQEELDYLIRKSDKFIPKTAEKIRCILALLNKKAKDDIFTELLSLCDIFNKETGKFCVVIFDEFHNLESLGVKNLYREWSKLLILQKNTMYIIVSSMQFKARTVLSKNLSLLFGNFELITAEPFDIKTSEEYINYKLTNINLDLGLKDFLVYFTGGYPFYLDIITDALLKSNQLINPAVGGQIQDYPARGILEVSPNRFPSEPGIGERGTDIIDILENLLFIPSGILNQRFSNYLKCFMGSPYSNDYISILYLIASGHNKLKDIAHILHKTKKDMNIRINRLLELDIATRSGDFLKINDRVFSFWLRFVYQGKVQSLTFDAKNQKTLFRENIESMIREFLCHCQKPMVERMKELFCLFGDEVVQIEKKKLRLVHFREIKPLEFNQRNLKEGLIGRSRDSLWIIALKYDLLTEDDITEFAKECRRYRHKLQKKIIIAFQEIDANARLRALEEKILTWNVNNLNQILDLFFKPQVII